MVVNMHDAKSNLSKLIARAEEGEEIVIARAGKPVARLVPIGVDDATVRRPRGLLRGKIRIHDDFDAPLPDAVLAAFGETNALEPTKRS
jgi:prevent-host-death family protein